MLNARNISFRAGDNILLDDTSVSFEPAKLHVIMGPNGAGKSTLMKILAGSEKPFSGKVFLHHTALEQYSLKELAKERAVLSQHYNISFPILVEDVVMMGRYPYFGSVATAEDHNICGQSMRLMQVESLAKRDYNSLSGGEAQKVMMSRVLAQVWQHEGSAIKILFLDEPVSHLDIRYQHQLMQTARSFADNGAIVIAILHDVNLALKYADRLLLMKDARIHYDVTPSGMDESMLNSIFGINATILDTGNGKWVMFEPGVPG